MSRGLNTTSVDLGVPVSAPERALLELVSDAGKFTTIEDVARYIEMAGDLRQSVLHQLLSHCTRVKVIKLVRDLGYRTNCAWASIAQQHVERLGADKRWSYLSIQERRAFNA